ncbi:MAG: substrate-binding domain-containing protein [Actinobacteria bacterium]|nr:substrate-binding domain-containing protein [Actinomycetota bacterium]
MNPVRLQDVAERAGVSPKTVSRVVNRESRVSAATREKVQTVIDELNFRPNKSAQSLAAARSLLVGLLYDNPNSAYITGLQEGVLSACDKFGYGLVIHPCDNQDVGLVKRVQALIAATRMDGLVLSPPLTENEAILDLLAEYRMPYVLISPFNQRQSNPLVFTDDVSAARQVMQHLFDLGHRRIGFIRGLKHRSGSEMRFAGYKQALEEKGIPFDRGLVAEGKFTFEAAETGARTLLSQENAPTAIFASSDYMAAGALKAASSMGMSVPGDLSICGFDDNPIARYLTPTLTTMRHPVRQLAEYAGELLISRLKKDVEVTDPGPSHSELIVRESTGPVNPQPVN